MAKNKLITESQMNKAIQEALNGISYSKFYEKVFTDSDWAESNGQYTITISESDHELTSVNAINLFKLTDNGYTMTHGIFDTLDYTITINGNNHVIIITTNAFSGKIVLICNNGESKSDSL